MSPRLTAAIRKPQAEYRNPKSTMPSFDFGPPTPCPPAEYLRRAAYEAGAVRLRDIAPTDTRWLWPGRIPLGRLTMLVSDPGLGKSLLTLEIAARVSRGAPWPDEQRAESKEQGVISTVSGSMLSAPCSVLLLTAEDDLADTVRPRLESFGADSERILAIDSVPGQDAADVPRAFALNRDLARLANLLDAMPDCRLVIVDPISAFLGGTNEHANAEVRTLLFSLAATARRRGVAILAVSHLRKKAGAAIHRAMGSLAFIAAARAGWVICKDSTDANKRLLLPLKNNLAPDTTGLSFTIETGSTNRAPVIRWSPDVVHVSAETMTGTARCAGRPDDERQYAIDWLRDRLTKGARLARDLKREAYAHGISYGTLRRAFRALGAMAVREHPFPHAQWLWKLPGTDAQNTGGEFCAPVENRDDFIDNLLNEWQSSIQSLVPRAP
jgi:hypothetical protein